MTLKNKNAEQPHASHEILEDTSLYCGARTRQHKICKNLRVRGKKRCRMHGGAFGSGAPKNNRNALRHGRYSRERIEMMREIREMEKYVDRFGNIDFSQTREESLLEVIADGSLNEKIDNLLNYFGKGLINNKEFRLLMRQAKHRRCIQDGIEMQNYLNKIIRVLG